LLGAEQFAMMKPTAYFLNLARAAVTDEEALVQALRDKTIAGAGLDVYMQEPPPADHPFLQMDNVIALPHIGGNTVEVNIHHSRILVPDIERIMHGQRPQFLLNPEVWDGFKLEQTGNATRAQRAPAKPAAGYPTREAMTNVVQKMIQSMQTDDRIVEAIKGLNFSFATDIRDLKIRYFFAFRNGQVSGGVGDDPQGTILTLGMDSATFDDLFLGVKDTMGLAMSGKVSFSGDTSSGMAMMSVMGNIQRAYKQAKGCENGR
jgi:autoinducer 2 (AI-2) kinase